jgi:hypothetical protein
LIRTWEDEWQDETPAIETASEGLPRQVRGLLHAGCRFPQRLRENQLELAQFALACLVEIVYPWMESSECIGAAQTVEGGAGHITSLMIFRFILEQANFESQSRFASRYKARI